MTSKPFFHQHLQEFGLQVAERDPTNPNVVTAVRCLFCVYLGREPRVVENETRPRSQRVQVWKKTFSPFLYKSHHEGQHAAQWLRYQACSPAGKDAFFAGLAPINDDQQAVDVTVVGAATTGTPIALAPAITAPSARSNASASPVAPVAKRPVGRPRADGSIPIQWTDQMTQRLMELRWGAAFTNMCDSNIRMYANDCVFGVWLWYAFQQTEYLRGLV